MSDSCPQWPILMVDDEPSWLRSLSMSLKSSSRFNNLLKCSDSRKVMAILKEQQVSLILLDLVMPHISGQDLLLAVREEHPRIPVIILSGLNQLESAVECMKHGAFDYYVKTEDQQRLFSGIRQALEHSELENRYERLKNQLFQAELSHPEAFAGIVTKNKKMEAIFKYIEAIAPSKEAVLISGESGVGKELIAKAIHRAGAPDQPWVAVNVAGLDDTVFSDTLFGHAKGAFTGAERARQGLIERAGSGTLFLDEIGDLSASSQVKLLRLLQDREYYVLGSDIPRKCAARFVFATNQPLTRICEDGAFRKDFYFRLRTHQIEIPPLRQRAEDISLLAAYFVEEACTSLQKDIPDISATVIQSLKNYAFPGNIRELRSMIHDAVAVHKGGLLTLQPFRNRLIPAADGMAPAPFGPHGAKNSGLRFDETLPTLEEAGRLLVEEAMKRSNRNQTLAALSLGITRQALSKRLKKYSQ